MYRWFFKRLLSRLDPERAHALAKVFLRLIPQPLLRICCAPHRSLRLEAMGLSFPSPFGLAAGFDKDAEVVSALLALGFGHVEVGTVTPRAQKGNPRPRLFRLKADRALINRMGFNNAGARALAKNLARKRLARGVVGINLGKNLDTPIDKAAKDYARLASNLSALADYLVINVSSPNTPGLRNLQAPVVLEPIVEAVLAKSGRTPVMLKISPDLVDEQILEIVEVVRRYRLAGIVAANTTTGRPPLKTEASSLEQIGAGGLSGPSLAERSIEILKLLRRSLDGSFCLISVGGVEGAEDVRKRLEAGATLVQGYTAFVYHGPFWALKINRSLKKSSRDQN